jgi:hypothetical protein
MLAEPVYNSAAVADYKAQVLEPEPDSSALARAYRPDQKAANTTAARAYKQPGCTAAARVPALDKTAVLAQNY